MSIHNNSDKILIDKHRKEIMEKLKEMSNEEVWELLHKIKLESK